MGNEKCPGEEKLDISFDEAADTAASKKRKRERPNLKNWLVQAPVGWNTASKTRKGDSDGS